MYEMEGFKWVWEMSGQCLSACLLFSISQVSPSRSIYIDMYGLGPPPQKPCSTQDPCRSQTTSYHIYIYTTNPIFSIEGPMQQISPQPDRFEKKSNTLPDPCIPRTSDFTYMELYRSPCHNTPKVLSPLQSVACGSWRPWPPTSRKPRIAGRILDQGWGPMLHKRLSCPAVGSIQA